MADQATLDMHARSLGFPSYAAYAAWQANRNPNNNPQPAPAPAPAPQQAAPPATPGNWFQNIMAQMPPWMLIHNASEAYRKAQGG